MSIMECFDGGWLVSHEHFINNVYRSLNYKLKGDLFNIKVPYVKNKSAGDGELKKRKRKCADDCREADVTLKRDIDLVKQTYLTTILPHLLEPRHKPNDTHNNEALELSRQIYTETQTCCQSTPNGGNQNKAIVVNLGQSKFLFPKHCRFYCKDVSEIDNHLQDQSFDLVVLDPPWWNKYVRRKKAKTDHGYSMMYNNDLKGIPLERFLKDDSVVAVWCTNSRQHQKVLVDEIFRKWNISYVGKWYWLKVTTNGDPVCNFSEPPGKQPFEQILFGIRNSTSTKKPTDGKIVVSVPSALHSHKPPLVELLQPYLPENSKCLEIFARYLVPNWTSYGLEAIRFQHECLYEKIDNNHSDAGCLRGEIENSVT